MRHATWRWLGGLVGAVAVAPLAAAQEPTGAAAPAPADAPVAADQAPGRPPMTEGQKFRFREPVRAWPFVEVDQFDRDVLGPDPGGRPLKKMIDVDVLAPLFGWHDEEREAQGEEPAGHSGHAYALPLFWTAWQPRGHDAFVLPVGGWSSRPDQFRAYLFPVAGSVGVGKDGWDASLAWPFLSAGKRGDAWWARLAPVLWAGGDATGTDAAVVPLFWYGERKKTGIAWLASPIALHASGPANAYTMVTPLWHSWRDKKGGRGADVSPIYVGAWGPGWAARVTPVGFGWSGRDAFTMVGPFFRYRNARGDVRAGLLPVAAYATDTNGKRRAVWAAPLNFHFADGITGKHLTLVAPFFLGLGNGKGHTRWMAAPGIYHERTPTRSLTAAFPLFWRNQDLRTGDGSMMLFPLAYERRVGKQHTLVAPFWFEHDDATRSIRYLFPLGGWSRHGDRQRTHVLFPLASIETDKAGSLSALDLLAPLGHWSRTGDRTRWRALPLGFGDTGPDGAHSVLFPLLFHRSGKDWSQTLALPFFAAHREGRVSRGIGPLVWWQDAPGIRERVLFPILWDIEREELGGRTLLCLPIGVHRRTKTSATTAVGGLFWYHREGREWSALGLPAFWARGDGNRTWGTLAPLAAWWRDDKADKTFVLAPLAHYMSDKDKASWSFAFPLLWGAKRGPDRWSVRLGWELFAVEQDGPQAFEWRVLGRLARYQSLGDERIFELNPLIRWETKGDHYKYVSFLWGLYRYEREGADTSHRILWALTI